MTDVLVCGSTATDMIFSVEGFPDAPQKYRATDADIVGGGCAGNAAVGIARLGGTARLAARMGRDMIGDLTVGELVALGVDCSLIQWTEAGKSAFSSVLVDPAGERQIVAFRGSGLAEDLTGIDLGRPAAVLADTRWPGGARMVLDHARTLGIPGVLDGEEPVEPELAHTASHVAFSAQGLRAFTGQADLMDGLRQAATDLPGWVCVTDGENGVFHVKGDQIAHVPAYRVTVVDTLGAGDIWHGAFTLSLAEGADEGRAIRFANAAAALKCTRAGGRKGAPGRGEVIEFMQRNGHATDTR